MQSYFKIPRGICSKSDEQDSWSSCRKAHCSLAGPGIPCTHKIKMQTWFYPWVSTVGAVGSNPAHWLVSVGKEIFNESLLVLKWDYEFLNSLMCCRLDRVVQIMVSFIALAKFVFSHSLWRWLLVSFNSPVFSGMLLNSRFWCYLAANKDWLCTALRSVYFCL